MGRPNSDSAQAADPAEQRAEESRKRDAEVIVIPTAEGYAVEVSDEDPDGLARRARHLLDA